MKFDRQQQICTIMDHDEVNVHWGNRHPDPTLSSIWPGHCSLQHMEQDRDAVFKTVHLFQIPSSIKILDWRLNTTMQKCNSFYNLMLLNSTLFLTNTTPSIFTLSIFLQVLQLYKLSNSKKYLFH